MQDFDATLGIYSAQSELIDRLELKFKDKYLDVLVFDDANNSRLKDFNYLIINLLNGNTDFDSIKKLVTVNNGKIIVLIPLYVESEQKYIIDTFLSDLLDTNSNLGVILVPELLGNGVEFDKNNISHSLIMQSLVSERVKIVNENILINTVSLNKLVDTVVKEIFSFGVSGERLALVGPRRSPKSFSVNNLGIEPENLIVQNSIQRREELIRTSSLKVDFSLNMAVKSTINTFLPNIKLDENIIKKENPLVIQYVGKKILRRLFKISLLLISIISIPLVSLIVSIVLLFMSTRFMLFDSVKAHKYIDYSLNTIEFSRRISFNIPFYYDLSNIIYKSASLLSEGIELSKVGSEFISRIMGDTVYDLSSYSDNISASLDKIHTDMSFLQSDFNELNGLSGIFSKKILNKANIDIKKNKEKVLHIKNLASRLSYLLGMERPMKYLVLFQNNMELRPTGGFIGSFAILSFDKGRMSEIVVSDVYSADGQLKGHVDPPEPIRIYLGEGGWYMRDSNWDPNFPESAKKIEWFLEKETNTQVDGVIAIDLFFVQKLLSVVGPLKLNDYNKVITPENLYSNTQEEVESNFFPGSIKKASFITGLAKQLITEVESIKSDKYFSLIKQIYDSLESKHIQIYLHDLNSQDSIDKMGYSGSLLLNTECGLRCFKDQYSVIDANLGVNKANLFVKRSSEVNLTVGTEFVNHELLITYDNTANPALGDAGLYKTYTRVIVPNTSNIVGVRSYNVDGGFEDIPFDITDLNGNREVGFLIKVLPNSTEKILISWNINTDKLKNGGEFDLSVRKQAGTENDKLTLNISNSDLALTGRAPSVYTTALDRDFNLKLFFRP